MRVLRVCICQYNFILGNINYNVEKIKKGIDNAYSKKCDIVVFPELAITGYPPEDLIYKLEFIEKNIEGLKEIIKFSRAKDILIIFGYINKNDNIYNSAAIIYNGNLIDTYNKIYLPNYSVFDEKRYFTPGNEIPIYIYQNVKIGVNICEDIWYPTGPLHYQTVKGGAELVINISASPYHIEKIEYRENMFKTRAGDESVLLVNCNLVGGQDELVFDGNSTIFNENGEIIARLKAFEEDEVYYDLDIDSVYRKRLKDIRRRQEIKYLQTSFEIKQIIINTYNQTKLENIFYIPKIEKKLTEIEYIYKALKLGLKDYVTKNNFKTVLVAISGGIDSALVATIAVDALGSDKVKGIFLPTNFSSNISREDAIELSKNLGIELFEIPIQELFEKYLESLKPLFKDLPFSTAEENIQSRIRGNIVMALSNKFGWLVLTTGNKSEMSTGYATLYGDMAGGFAVIKDILKTTVYELVKYRNSIQKVIPERIITRPPSAELRPNQKDTDSLPEYEILDKIIKLYIEEDRDINEIINKIGNEEIVRKTIKLIDINEYKRRQAPPGIKISQKAFGKDRRIPITNQFKS